MKRVPLGREMTVVAACLALGCGGGSDSPSTSSPGEAGDVGGAEAANAGGVPGTGGGLSGAGGAPSSGGGAGRSATRDAGADSGRGKTTDDAAVADARQSAAPFDWVGVVGTGQSLAEGWESTAISTVQKFENLKLVDQGADPKYPIADSSTAKWSAIPLTEPIRMYAPGSGTGYDDFQYPNNLYKAGDNYGETPHSGMANTLSFLWQGRGLGDYVSAHTVVGVGGAGIAQIAKGTRGYRAAVNEAKVWKSLALAAGKTYGVAGIIFTHGETDATNAGYGSSVYQLWQDYNADLKAATGQQRDLVMLASQQSSSAPGYDGSQVQLWRASVDHPAQIVCTGPKYQYGPYGLHMSGGSYERLGEKYGEVFDLIVNQGVAWKPLGPNKVSRSGAIITIDMHVPNPPLVWDAHLVQPHQTMHTAWSKGHGFEVVDESGDELSIVSAEIAGNTVVLTLAQPPPVSAKLTVGYALTADTSQASYLGGTDDGPHGRLRDSDDLVGDDAEEIAVEVKNGSPNPTGPPDAFGRRAPHDIVTGPGVPSDTILTAAAYWGMALSQPWPGASGTVKLSFHHDLRNYCVHFAMPVP